MVFPSIGVGPITSQLSGLFIRKSVEWGRSVSVRDEDSARVLRAIGVRRDLANCPDMGWAHELSRVRDESSQVKTVIGVNVMSHEDPRYWPNGDQSRYDAYLRKMTTFVANRLRHGDGVLLFGSQTRADRRVVDDLRRHLGARRLAGHPRLDWAVDGIETVQQFVEAVARCDYVVAARFHSVLVPLSLGIPTIGLAYQPKTRELLAQVGRPARCFDIDSFEVGELEAALEKLRAEDQPSERAELLSVADRFRNAVEEQFDLLLPSQP